MIPCEPFLAEYRCEKCREIKDHRITFLIYNPMEQMVSFEAICLDCEEESESDSTIIGFTASTPVYLWEQMCPEEDFPSAN